MGNWNCVAGVECHRTPCGFQHLFLWSIYTHTLKVKINFLNWVCNPFHPIPYLSWTWHVYACLCIFGFQQFKLCWWASDWFMVLTPRTSWTSCNGGLCPLDRLLTAGCLVESSPTIGCSMSLPKENGRVTMSCSPSENGTWKTWYRTYWSVAGWCGYCNKMQGIQDWLGWGSLQQTLTDFSVGSADTTNKV